MAAIWPCRTDFDGRKCASQVKCVWLARGLCIRQGRERRNDWTSTHRLAFKALLQAGAGEGTSSPAVHSTEIPNLPRQSPHRPSSRTFAPTWAVTTVSFRTALSTGSSRSTSSLPAWPRHGTATGTPLVADGAGHESIWPRLGTWRGNEARRRVRGRRNQLPHFLCSSPASRASDVRNPPINDFPPPPPWHASRFSRWCGRCR